MLFSAVSPASLAVVYRQLGLMLGAGMGSVEALRLIIRRTHGRMREAVDRVRVEVGSGRSLRDALAADPDVFHARARAFVGAGEATGSLPAIFAALAADLETRVAVRRRIVRACLYPATLLTLSFFVLPLAKLVSAGVGAYLRAALVPFVATAVGLGLTVRLAPRALRGRPRARARLTFLRQLGAALGAGLDVFTALRLAADATADAAFIARIDEAAARVRAGSTLENALAPTALFDDESLLAIAGGEAAGALDTALAHQARALEEQLLHRLEIAIQVGTTAALLLVYAIVAWRLYGEYRQALGQTPDLEELMKTLDPGALPPELR
jgi:general secretion pathway protein F